MLSNTTVLYELTTHKTSLGHNIAKVVLLVQALLRRVLISANIHLPLLKIITALC